MKLFKRSGQAPALPEAVRSAIPLTGAERVLAHAVDGESHAHVVITSYALVVLEPDWSAEGADPFADPPVMPERFQVAVRRPWHEVDAGSWEPLTGTVSMTWTDGSRPGQWTFGPGHDRFADAFRERVTASVLVSETMRMGDRVIGQATIRRDLATGELIPVAVYARGVRRTDPAVAAYSSQLLDFLGEQVGL